MSEEGWKKCVDETRKDKQVYQNGNGGGQVVSYFLSFRSWDVLLGGGNRPPQRMVSSGECRPLVGLIWDGPVEVLMLL